MRVHLLFKPVDALLPAGISSFEVATLKLRRIVLKRPPGWSTNRLVVAVQTDSETRYIKYDDGSRHTGSHQRSASTSSQHSIRSTKSNANVKPEYLDWALKERGYSKVMAVEYRHSCFLVLRFLRQGKTFKKDEHLGVACLRLHHIPDDSLSEMTVPVYDTADMNEACDMALDRERAIMRDEPVPFEDLPQVTVTFNLFAGVSRAHAKLAKRNVRLRHVYEAWQCVDDIGGHDPAFLTHFKRHRVQDVGVEPEEESDSHGSISSDDEDIPGRDGEPARGSKKEPPTDAIAQHDGEIGAEEDQNMQLDSDEDYGDSSNGFTRWVDHHRALGRQHKGLMQNKFVRTLKFGKDKVTHKVLSTSHKKHLQHRTHGADLNVEMEGISKI